jgi:hypothetical protein
MVQDGLRLSTVKDLVVEHRESKTYLQAVSWMWRSGVDATALLFEFGALRLPDLAWIVWGAGLLSMILVAAMGAAGIWVAAAAATALTILISLLFVGSRFLPRPRPLRFLIALLITPPLILAYLGGRCAGLFLLKGFLHHAARTPMTH